jgi:membrane protease YdiL (CAAX protease family)
MGWWLLIAAGVPAVAMVTAVFAARATGDGTPFIPTAAIPIMVGVQVITGAIGEEFGWRGFLLSLLEKRTGSTGAAWIMGGLWSLWHLPAFLNPNMPHYFMPKAATLPFIAFFGVFLAVVVKGSGGSILATMLAHLTLNIMTGFGGVRLSSVTFWGTLAVIFGTCALLTTISKYNERGWITRRRASNH